MQNLISLFSAKELKGPKPSFNPRTLLAVHTNTYINLAISGTTIIVIYLQPKNNSYQEKSISPKPIIVIICCWQNL